MCIVPVKSEPILSKAFFSSSSNHDCVEFWYKSKSDVEEMIYDCQIIVDMLIMVWEKHFGQLESFKLMSENFSDFVLDSVQLTSQ